MSKFVTQRVISINAKELVEQLVIDGIKQLDKFEKALKGTTYISEYRTILKYIEHAANGNSLPEKKFKLLKGVKDNIVEYEFKSKHIRVYAIQMPNNKIIIFLGYKNTQASDIISFRSLKKRYLESLNK
ncbi:MAG: hypothetical protein IPJ81_08975 [Chitinophagaceae bacterium]|nr:hypothetical protein [Chitinophagaceae bacterium]